MAKRRQIEGSLEWDERKMTPEEMEAFERSGGVERLKAKFEKFLDEQYAKSAEGIRAENLRQLSETAQRLAAADIDVEITPLDINTFEGLKGFWKLLDSDFFETNKDVLYVIISRIDVESKDRHSFDAIDELIKRKTLHDDPAALQTLLSTADGNNLGGHLLVRRLIREGVLSMNPQAVTQIIDGLSFGDYGIRTFRDLLEAELLAGNTDALEALVEKIDPNDDFGYFILRDIVNAGLLSDREDLAIAIGKKIETSDEKLTKPGYACMKLIDDANLIDFDRVAREIASRRAHGAGNSGAIGR